MAQDQNHSHLSILWTFIRSACVMVFHPLTSTPGVFVFDQVAPAAQHSGAAEVTFPLLFVALFPAMLTQIIIFGTFFGEI